MKRDEVIIKGKLHIRDENHRTIKYYLSGELYLHREDNGPAIIYLMWGNIGEWYKHGLLHRENGPALIDVGDGTEKWYKNGHLHRENGPAIEWADGKKEWYKDGELHREDGPAIENICGIKAWYINNKHLTEEQFNKIINKGETK